MHAEAQGHEQGVSTGTPRMSRGLLDQHEGRAYPARYLTTPNFPPSPEASKTKPTATIFPSP